MLKILCLVWPSQMLTDMDRAWILYVSIASALALLCLAYNPDQLVSSAQSRELAMGSLLHYHCVTCQCAVQAMPVCGAGDATLQCWRCQSPATRRCHCAVQTMPVSNSVST